MSRLAKVRSQVAEVDPASWPSEQVAYRTLADAIHAFRLDLEAISFPKSVMVDGQTNDLGQDATDLIGWSKELETVLRQIAASTSLEAANRETVEFSGSSYPMSSFYQDATGEWGAALHITARDLGVDLGKSAPSSSPS